MSGQTNITAHRHKTSAKPYSQRARAAGESQQNVSSSCFLQIINLLDDTQVAQDILICTETKLSEEPPETKYWLKPRLNQVNHYSKALGT